uniref:Uncharacterized protein n=1 Tax=Romanomermis culicivorax TaxID=13658 RepID=A0A915L3H4_ROMCU
MNQFMFIICALLTLFAVGQVLGVVRVSRSQACAKRALRALVGPSAVNVVRSGQRGASKTSKTTSPLQQQNRACKRLNACCRKNCRSQYTASCERSSASCTCL